GGGGGGRGGAGHPQLERRDAARWTVRRHSPRPPSERAGWVRSVGDRGAGGAGRAGRHAAEAWRLGGDPRAGAAGHLACAPGGARCAGRPWIRRSRPVPVARTLPGAGPADRLVPRRAELVTTRAPRDARPRRRPPQGSAEDELPSTGAEGRGGAAESRGPPV